MFLFLQYDACSSLDKASSGPFERGELSRGLAPSSTGQCYLRLMADPSATVLDVLAERSFAAVFGSLPEVWAAYSAERGEGRSPFSAAVRVAARCDRLGHAFAVGYPAALEHLVPGVELPCALCVTEAAGNSPRAIATTLRPAARGYQLDGTKTFVTFGTLAKALIIVARTGDKPDGRPDLVMVRIPADRGGVELDELPPTPFVPEVVHARVRLEAVEVRQDERLPGDGYLRYVKPFRTIEDIHVVGATLGYVLGWARRAGVERSLFAELGSDLVALDGLLAFEPLDPRAQVALHGVYQHVATLLAGDAFARLLSATDHVERERWERDRTLLHVASKAREARFDAATKALGATPA